MIVSAIFGIKARTIDDAKFLVESVSRLKATARFSDYYGVYYTFDVPTGDVELISGVISDQGEKYPAEPDFPNWNFLLRIDRVESLVLHLESIQASTESFQQLSMNSNGT